MAGMGSLMEVKRSWDICALADAHELLDLKEDAERKAHQDAQRQGAR